MPNFGLKMLSPVPIFVYYIIISRSPNPQNLPKDNKQQPPSRANIAAIEHSCSLLPSLFYLPSVNDQTVKMSLTRLYLFTYNALAFTLWATSTTYAALLLTQQTPLPTIFNIIYNPYLLAAQSLAILEILHSLLGLVRAPVMTTLMQVASRLLLVWGIMYPFGDHGAAWYGGKIVGGFGGEAQLGDYAFLGCLGAWGITECIRYGFFALQVGGVGVPGWWTWLRYVLFPLGSFGTGIVC